MSGSSLAGPELSLITDSVDHAGARIRFFRIAYGAAGTERMSRRDILAILSDVGRSSRITVEWEPAGDASRRDVQLAFLAIQCLETAMPFGGWRFDLLLGGRCDLLDHRGERRCE